MERFKLAKFQRFLARLKVAYKLAFKHNHGICIFLQEHQLAELVQNNSISDGIHISYFGMMGHHMGQVVKICAEGIGDTEIICSKAEFDAEAYESVRNKE